MQCVVRYNVHKLLRAKNFFVGTEKQESFDFRGDHFDVKALWCQEATEQEYHTTVVIDSERRQDTECRQNRSSHEALHNESDVGMLDWTQHGECWRAVESGHKATTRRSGSVTSRLRELEQDTQAAESLSAVDA